MRIFEVISEWLEDLMVEIAHQFFFGEAIFWAACFFLAALLIYWYSLI